MGATEPTDLVSDFTHELLRVGNLVFGVASDLVEELPPDAYPGEDPAEVIIQMVTGTIGTAVGDTDPAELERATELIGMACDRVLEHLRLALELSRRMHGEDGTSRDFG
jgi:signal transduction histidine kinase